MKRFVMMTAVAVVAAAATTLAGPTKPLTLNWGQHLNARACDASGPPVINVMVKVRNDADSGEAGNFWAFDDYNKQIQVFPQADGTYCAIVRSTGGKFDAQAGQTSPGGGNTLSGNDDGTFEGGYMATIDGTLLANPAWRTHGNVGTVDYACDLAGNCPGVVSWLGQYFARGYSFEYQWWGWIYHAGRNGTWVNSIDGNAGDIK